MPTDTPLLTYLLANEPSFRKARLAALYSDFSSLRTLNLDGYNANITSWIHGLSHAARAGALPSFDSLILTLDETLFRELNTAQWGRPLALGTVVEEAVGRREWMGLKEFTEAKESVLRRNWRVPSIGEILGWGLRQLGLGFGGGKINTGRLVLLGNLEGAAKEFMMRTAGKWTRVETVWSLRAFKEEFRDLLGTEKGLSDIDFGVLLQYLRRDKGVVSWDGETIKLRATGESDVITQEDSTIASLKTLIKDLNVQTKVLETKVDELNLTARQAVEKKNRVSAVAALRSKKLAESTLVKRHATLAQLEEVFASIEQASDQIELVRVMESSAKVLKGLNKEVGGVERVDVVVDQLREQMGQVDEVGNVIAEAEQVGVDEGEVDDELAAMEGEERAKIEEAERKEREEREMKEAEETRKRLDALGEAERVAQKNQTADAEKTVEKEVNESVRVLKRMSLDAPGEESVPV